MLSFLDENNEGKIGTQPKHELTLLIIAYTYDLLQQLMSSDTN